MLDQIRETDAAGIQSLTTPAGWGILGVPLDSGDQGTEAIVCCGRALSVDCLPMAVVVARALGLSLRTIDSRELTSRRAERLRSTLQITSSFAKERKSGRLLPLCTQAAVTLEEAVSEVLSQGRVRTPGIGGTASTIEVAQAVANALRAILQTQ